MVNILIKKGEHVMARHGENIRKREDGRWEGRYSVYAEEKGKKVYHSVYGKSYEEVKEKLNLKKSLLKDTISFSKKAENCSYKMVKFSDAAKEWLLEISAVNKVSTFVKYRFIYEKYLAVALGECRVVDINNNMVNKEVSEHLSESIQKSIYCVMNQILRYASKHYGISIPVIKRQSSKIKKRPVEVLTKMEQAQLFSSIYLEMDIYKMAVAFCLYTGVRIGELCALRWTDIDMKNRLIYINRTVQRVAVSNKQTKTILLESVPKSEYSKREIPISVSLLDLLKKFSHDKPYIFGGNKPLEPRTLQYRFKKLLVEAELSAKNFHILRHTFATNCMEGGIDVKSLSELLGHSDIQITLNKYVHPSMDTKRKQLEELSKIYGQIYGQEFRKTRNL